MDRVQAARTQEGFDFQLTLGEVLASLQAITTLPTVTAVSQAQYDALQTQYNNLASEKQEVEDHLSVTTNDATNLQKDIQELRETIRSLNRLTRTVTPATAPAEKLPKPEPFTGERDKLRPFLAQLRLQTATRPDVQSRLRYAISLLRGDALNQVLPYIRDERVELSDLAALITILENAFGNPNHVKDSEYKLNTIQQGSRDFSSYFAEFQRHAAEVTWNEDAKLAALHRGLAYRLQQDLVTVQHEPTNLDEWVALCQKFDNRRRALQHNASYRPPSSSTNRSNPTALAAPKAAPATHNTTSRTMPSNPPPRTTATGTHAGPMDLSAASSRHLISEERVKQMTKSLCLYCRDVSHMAVNCPRSSYNRSRRSVQITAATVDSLSSVESAPESAGKAQPNND